MSVYPPPNQQQGSIFNPDDWIIPNQSGVSTEFLNANYLQFPVAQGNINLSGMNNIGITTCDDSLIANSNIFVAGVDGVNYLEFPDGSQQFTAGSGGDFASLSVNNLYNAGVSNTYQGNSSFISNSQINLNAGGGGILFPSSLPTEIIVPAPAGIGFLWNQATSTSGETDLLCYGQGGEGGLDIYTTSTTTAINHIAEFRNSYNRLLNLIGSPSQTASIATLPFSGDGSFYNNTSIPYFSTNNSSVISSNQIAVYNKLNNTSGNTSIGYNSYNSSSGSTTTIYGVNNLTGEATVSGLVSIGYNNASPGGGNLIMLGNNLTTSTAYDILFGFNAYNFLKFYISGDGGYGIKAAVGSSVAVNTNLTINCTGASLSLDAININLNGNNPVSVSNGINVSSGFIQLVSTATQPTTTNISANDGCYYIYNGAPYFGYNSGGTITNTELATASGNYALLAQPNTFTSSNTFTDSIDVPNASFPAGNSNTTTAASLGYVNQAIYDLFNYQSFIYSNSSTTNTAATANGTVATVFVNFTDGVLNLIGTQITLSFSYGYTTYINGFIRPMNYSIGTSTDKSYISTITVQVIVQSTPSGYAFASATGGGAQSTPTTIMSTGSSILQINGVSGYPNPGYSEFSNYTPLTMTLVNPTGAAQIQIDIGFPNNPNVYPGNYSPVQQYASIEIVPNSCGGYGTQGSGDRVLYFPNMANAGAGSISTPFYLSI